MHGRAFKISYDHNELTRWGNNNQSSIWKVVSLSGAGLFQLQTESRITLFNLFDSVFNNNAKLMFNDRKHLRTDEKLAIPNYEHFLKKYPNNINTGNYGEYIEFLSSGDFSINSAGLCLSTPFRFVDSVIANKCIISTKIYHDIYKTFPCVQLPICGYFGTGDWAAARAVLENIHLIKQNEMLQKAKDWYSWFLSADGMWNNQILTNLKGKI